MQVTYHIYELRDSRGMSLRELAERSGVSKSQISSIENGDNHPTIPTLYFLSKALGVKIYDLFTVFDEE